MLGRRFVVGLRLARVVRGVACRGAPSGPSPDRPCGAVLRSPSLAVPPGRLRFRCGGGILVGRAGRVGGRQRDHPGVRRGHRRSRQCLRLLGSLRVQCTEHVAEQSAKNVVQQIAKSTKWIQRGRCSAARGARARAQQAAAVAGQRMQQNGECIRRVRRRVATEELLLEPADQRGDDVAQHPAVVDVRERHERRLGACRREVPGVGAVGVLDHVGVADVGEDGQRGRERVRQTHRDHRERAEPDDVEGVRRQVQRLEQRQGLGVQRQIEVERQRFTVGRRRPSPARAAG